MYDGHLYDVATMDGLAHPFRFARILELNVTDSAFDYPNVGEYDPAALFHDSIGVWLGEPEPCTVRIRLDASWAIYARHHRWHSSQTLERELDDGSVVVRHRLRPCPELEQWVLRFAEAAEVLEPATLRDRIAARLRAATRRYETT